MEHNRTSRKNTSLAVRDLKDFNTNDIIDFCKFANAHTSDPAHVNMFHKDWQTHPETLPYLIYLSPRFLNDNGKFFVLTDKDKIIGISGIHVSNFDSNVALGGVRTWLPFEYRGKFLIGKYVLPKQLEWAKNKNLKTIALTFNSYNKDLIKYFKRSGLGIKKNRNPNSMFYNGVYEVDYPCNIQHTKQWVIYDKIDMNYEPNWHKLKWHDNSQ